MNAKTPVLLVLTLIFALVLCGTASAGTPLQENQTGTVSGDLYYNASNPWAQTTQGETNEVAQANTLPSYTSIDSARVYVNVYSGSGTNNWPVRTTVKIDGNGDGDYDDPGELLGTEDMDIPSSTDGTVYWKDGVTHWNKVYSDYQVWYDVTGLITSNNPTVYVKTERMGGAGYDGRIKMIALVAAYNDGDNDQVHYWVLNGQDWINAETSTSTFNTATFNGQASSATLNIVASSGTDGTYTFNGNTKIGNLTETGTYYKEHTWDVTGDINSGANSTLTYANVGSSVKLNLATLTIRAGAAAPVANFTATPTNGTSPLNVDFTDTSTGTVTGWAWDFNNDGIIDSTLQNPTYTYNNGGTYTVNLSVTGPAGTDTEIKTNYITVTVNTIADTAWPKFGLNSKNTGQSQYNGPQTNNTIWTYNTGNYIEGSAAIAADGTIYIANRGRKLYAINPDGTLKWSYTIGNVYGSPAIAADGTIYIGTDDKKLYAINPDGTLKWTYTTGKFIYGSPAIATDGTIYIGSCDKYLYAINPYGTLKWSYNVEGYNNGAPAIATDGTIYFGTDSKKLYAINPDGTLKWSYTTGKQIFGSPAIGTDGTIYIGSRDSILYALNPDGTLKWSYTTGDQIYGSPAIGADGTIYIGNFENKIYAINPDGTLKWVYTTGNQIYGSPAIGADGTLYIGSRDRNLYAFQDAIIPVASFTFRITNGTEGYIPLTIQFTDTSLNYPKTWLWDFGDGTTSTEENPSHTYITAGTYTVKLIASNNAGSNEQVKTNLITVATPSTPEANFNTTPLSGITPFSVQFTDQSTGINIAYAWDFNGDGITDSTNQNPSWIYTTAGNYTVKLTVSNAGGSDDEVKTDYIIAVTDTQAPIVTANPSGGNLTTSQVILSVVDDLDPNPMIYYTIDGTDPTSTSTLYTSPVNITQTTTLKFIAMDHSGNTSPIQTETYTDITAPTVSANPVGGDYDEAKQVTLTATDNVDLNPVIYYTLDNTDPSTTSTLYAGPIRIGDIAGGTTTLKFIALDASGNTSPVQTETYKITDTKAPTVTATPAGGNLATPTQIKLTATDNVDTNPTIYYTTDGTDPTTKNTQYTGSINITTDTTLKFIAVDAAGNTSPVQTETYIMAPELSASVSITNYPISKNQATVTVNNTGVVDAGAFNVTVQIGENSTTVNIPGLVAGESTTFTVTDTVRHQVGDTITVNVTVDPENVIQEADESNNSSNTNVTIATTGILYDGGRFSSGVDLVNTIVYAEGNIGVRILEYGGYRWLDYSNTATWTTSDLNIPVGATIISARLYQAWTWYADPHYTIQFNSHETQQHVAKYTDCIAGQYVFDVTEYFNVNGDNTAYITSGPANYGTMLVVIYESASEPYRQIWINEGADCLMLGPPGFTTFGNVITNSLSSAKVTTVMLSGESGDIEKDLAGDADYIVFNEQTFHRSGYGIGADPGIYYFDVTSALENGTNELSVWGQTYLNFAIGVLEVTLKPPVADFTADITTGNGPLTVQFTDNSTDTTGWSWDFNNDGIVDSTLQNPTWIYNNPGYYTVKLNVIGPGGEDEEIKTDYVFVNGPDLVVTGITPNSGVGNVLFSNGTNLISVTVENQGTSMAPVSTLKVDIAGEDYMVNVPALGVGESATVTVTDNTSRSSSDSVPVNTDTDPNNTIPETNDSNNTLSTNLPVYNNGYRGKRYTNGNDINTNTVWNGNYDVIYSNGNSVYRSGGTDGSNWNTPYTASWTSSDLSIPHGANVVLARLYQPYTWNTVGGVPDWTAQFNGKTLYDLTYYTDTKSYGTSNYPSGLLVYDVTNLFQVNGNTLTLTKGANTTASLYGSYLVVIYEDTTTSYKRIYINDGADMLCSNPTYGTNDDQATAYANYNLNTSKMTSAQLVAILASAGDTNKSKFFFNGQEYTGFWNDDNGTTQTGFSLYNITSSVLNGFNTAALQSYNNGTNGDNMVALGTILVLTTDNQCPTINCNIQGGLSRTTQNITLTATDDQCTSPKIYYTLNGKEPTTNSTLYTKPININKTTTLKFIAVDDAGNTSPAQTEIYTIDTTQPTVTSVNPANNMVINTANKALVITFSEAIKAGSAFTSIKVTNPDGVKVNPLYKVISGKTLTLTRNGYYINGLTYTITLPTGSITDTAGNTLATAFTSKFKIDTTQPKITSVNPRNNSSGFSLTAPITITFSENILEGVNWSKITMKNLNTGKTVSFTKTKNGKTLTIKMTYTRLHKNTYQIYIPTQAVKDNAENKQTTPYTIKFKTQ